MIRYRADRATVTAVECNPPGYPHLDATGKTQYDNTHFDSEADAWARAIAEATAGVRLVGSRIGQLKATLRLEEQRASEKAEELAETMDNYARWRSHQPREKGE